MAYTRYFIEVHGERCDFATAAKRLGLSRATLYARRRERQPIAAPLGHGGKPRLVVINGTPRRICELSRETGLSASTIRHRLRRGVPPSEAIDPAYKPQHKGRRGRPITINGTTLDLLGWAKRCGISKQRMYQLFSKYSPEVAVMPKHERCQLFKDRRRTRGALGPLPGRIMCGGLEFTVKEWASLFEVTGSTIRLWNRLGVFAKQIAKVKAIAERIRIAEEAVSNKGN